MGREPPGEAASQRVLLSGCSVSQYCPCCSFDLLITILLMLMISITMIMLMLTTMKHTYLQSHLWLEFRLQQPRTKPPGSGFWIFKSRCKGAGRGSSWRARPERQLCWWQVKLPGGETIILLSSLSPHHFIIFTIFIAIIVIVFIVILIVLS